MFIDITHYPDSQTAASIIPHAGSPEARLEVATAVAKCVAQIEGRALLRDVPYMPNARDTTFWTVDAGNDWKVKFYDDEPLTLTLSHRYNKSLEVQQRMRAVADSFVAIWPATIVVR